jgi:hypothetical protein
MFYEREAFEIEIEGNLHTIDPEGVDDVSNVVMGAIRDRRKELDRINNRINFRPHGRR